MKPTDPGPKIRKLSGRDWSDPRPLGFGRVDEDVSVHRDLGQRFHETDQLGAPVVVPAKPPKGGDPRESGEPGPMDTELDVITPPQFYVYILTNRRHGTLYIGVTNDLVRRVYEHCTRAVAGFATRYSLDRLAYFEIFNDPIPAIEREK